MTKTTDDALARLASASGWATAAVALAAGAAHGFGKDDETMYGATHIALGHTLPILAAALTAVWLTAVVHRTATAARDLVWLAAAQVGLALWGAASAMEALGLYVLARTAPRLAPHHATPALARTCFVVAAVTVTVGLTGCLILAARAGSVSAATAVLVPVGTLGAFVAGPVGDALLALGLAWWLLRPRPATVALSPSAGSALR